MIRRYERRDTDPTEASESEIYTATDPTEDNGRKKPNKPRKPDRARK